MKIGVCTESYPGERRVALVPAAVAGLMQRKLEVLIQSGAGARAGYGDAAYEHAGAVIVKERKALFEQSDVLLMVRLAGANLSRGAGDMELMHAGQLVIGMMDPLGSPEATLRLALRKVTAFALELLPRITRAQSMDVLSAMANLAGYKAVLLAAAEATRILPLMMTAAGTLAPAKVLVLGVGVAGLQAIATAKRLGAVVEAYDVRPEVREQVQSVGGKFVDLELDTAKASDASGYAKAQSAEFLALQRERLAAYVRLADIVITTAQVPGRKAPILLTAAMLEGMKPGSVIVDLAAEQGGNCELTKPGETVEVDGVHIMGPVNLPSSLPFHASQLYAKNTATFVLALLDKQGALAVNMDDEIVRETLVARDGAVVHPRVKQALVPAQKSA